MSRKNDKSKNKRYVERIAKREEELRKKQKSKQEENK